MGSLCVSECIFAFWVYSCLNLAIAQGGGGMPKDPVCGLDLNDQPDSVELDFEGSTYRFCSEKCKNIFEENPQQYLKTQTSKRSKKQRKKHRK